jgi:hypothetical protein
MATDLFNVEIIPPGPSYLDQASADAVRLGEPCYITLRRTHRGLVAYVYVGPKYATPGATPADDELPIYQLDTREPKLFGRY